jgi:hypothetical protein
MPSTKDLSKQPAYIALQSRITDYFTNKALIKITLGKKRSKATDLQNVYIKPILLKNELHLNFVYRYTTKDITKNYLLNEALDEITNQLSNHFFNMDIYTTNEIKYVTIDKNENITVKNKPSPDATSVAVNLEHNHQKKRLIKAEQNQYLHQLGITTAEGVVKKEMQHKYKQINRYVEIIEGILKNATTTDIFNIADMGSGKGYLTFALYDYLQNTKQLNSSIVGIEQRDDLINKCNAIASACNFDTLSFKKGNIADVEIEKIDMLIALHACDTATDDAIFKGIKANAHYIICAPCCHKQIRKQIDVNGQFNAVVKHGILLERQSEILTDAMRALLLEAFGYKTIVFDFIETEHTPKNVLIVGTKKSITPDQKKSCLGQLKRLKEQFGIKNHYLETLLIG